ncbi:MAG: cellulose synthase family protein [Verrucomicrobiota bacterium]
MTQAYLFARSAWLLISDMLGLLWYFLYGIVVLGLSVYGVHRLWMIITFVRCRNQKHKPLSTFDVLPQVTIQLPIYNEKYVIKRLLAAVCDLDYPIERFDIQVLDDSTDETCDIARQEVERLKKQGFQIEYIHRTNREGFKAGALQNGLDKARGEFVAIFDADFVPASNLLRKSVDYFTDERIGMIQTRWGHINRGFSLLTRIQALLLDGHLLIEQTVRNRSGRFFNFNGTAGIWRKSTILDAGGWEHDTLTEDLDLSYRAQMQGWRFVFLPEVITPAELPVDMNAFKTQQHRWAKGAVQTCKKLLPRILSSELPLKIKLEAAFHLTSNFAYLLLAAMALLIIPDPKGNPDLVTLMCIHIPIFLLASFTVILFYALVLWQVRIKWYLGMVYLPMLIAVGIGLSINNAKAVLEALFNMESPFSRTPKHGIESKKRPEALAVYFSQKSWLVVLEFLMFAHYVHYIFKAFDYGLWLSLPFFVLFCAGFGYTALMSIGANNWADWIFAKTRVKSLITSHGI